jgi:hypothetical protein
MPRSVRVTRLGDDAVRITVHAVVVAIVLCGIWPRSIQSAEPEKAARAYGQWRIRVRPDKTNEYAELIGSKGLPLFREAGGRMVGWWTTLVGDLYEHVTIWEYDDMAAFERAGGKLGKDKRFAEFVALRDPLLVGEESQFMQLTDFAGAPQLPEQGKLVVHEIHGVPLSRREAYLKFMQTEGLGLLKRHGFRPVGPWTMGVGDWTQVTYLFAYDSLAQRQELLQKFLAHPDARAYGGRINELVESVTTRILLPAAFAHGAASGKTQ